MATRNSVNSIIGHLSEFKLDKDDWNNYIEQMEFTFLANSIDDDNKKNAVLLRSCGSDTFKLFKSLTAPNDLASSSYTDIKQLMSEHKNPKPNVFAERFKFNSRNRANNESISDYMAELKRLTQFCDYGTVLKDILRGRLVCGVNHKQIQQKLLSEASTLT